MEDVRNGTASPRAAAETDTRSTLLEAAATCLREHGYAGLTTRRVAEAAGMPLSQIHYHFGSKQKLVLDLLEHETGKLLQRQRTTFAEDTPLSARWDKACDYLDDDLASGYVLVLNEIIAAGYSDEELAAKARHVLRGWYENVRTLAEEAMERFGPLGPLTAVDLVTLVSIAFMGAEHLILAGNERPELPVRQALRKVGDLMRMAEAARA